MSRSHTCEYSADGSPCSICGQTVAENLEAHSLRRLVRRLDGYRAAVILVEKMLDEAEAKCPKRMLRINRDSAAYRAGVYEAVLTAHCWMVLGEFPEHNERTIREALKSSNDQAQAQPPTATPERKGDNQ